MLNRLIFSSRDRIASFIALSACLLPLISCSAAKRVTALPDTFLTDVDLSEKKQNLPFDHSWIVPGRSKFDYKYVYFRPVSIDYLPENEWMKSVSSVLPLESDFKNEAQEIAEYLHDQIVEHVNAQDDKRFIVVQRPVPNAMEIQIVLTELEFSHPVARAVSLAAPIPGTGVALASVSDPHIAFAARITDSSTGALIATVGDRKFAPTRLIDFNKLTVTSSPREICALWAKEIAQAIQSDGFTKIKEKRWSLIPW